MLTTAQTEIYALYELADSPQDIQVIQAAVNNFNLTLFSQREHYFRHSNLSASMSSTLFNYYCPAFITLFLLISGCFAGKYIKRSFSQRSYIKMRAQVPLAVQYTCQLFALSFLIFIPVIILITITYVMHNAVFSGIGAYCLPDISVSKCIAVFESIILAALMLITIYELVEKCENAVLVTGIFAVIQCYMSGCFVPYTLLYDDIWSIGRRLPASYIRCAFYDMYNNSQVNISQSMHGITMWILIFAAILSITVLVKMKNGGNARSISEHLAKNIQKLNNRRIFMCGNFRQGAFFAVIIKRLLHQKSIWITLILMAAVSGFIETTEQSSDNSVVAAVYDATGEYGQSFISHDGLVRFTLCDTKEEAEALVLSGKAECGYSIGENVKRIADDGYPSKAITVYEDDDAFLAPMINEVVFGIIFRRVSFDWYRDYVSEALGGYGGSSELLSVYDNILERDISFKADIVMHNASYFYNEPDAGTNANESGVIYPKTAIYFISLLLCLIQAAAVIRNDLKRGSFYGCAKIRLYTYTLLCTLALWGCCIMIF